MICLFSFCCRDLKDVLSQRSKVLFVHEPRMVRAAFVHFASHEDLHRARAAFRNTQVLGSIVDIVQVRHWAAKPQTFTCLVDLRSVKSAGA
jgi:RNA recognition motif-containing protein